MQAAPVAHRTARRGRSGGRSDTSTERCRKSPSGARPCSSDGCRLEQRFESVRRSRSMPCAGCCSSQRISNSKDSDAKDSLSACCPAQLQSSEATPMHSPGNCSGTSTSSTITVLSQATTLNSPPVMSSLPTDAEEFFEGGVELSPMKVDSSEDLLRLTTQPLSMLDSDEALQQFWPLVDRDLPKALFLDYDGTLREFETRPELAVPTDELLSLLAALNDRPDIRSHIISGRDSSFLETHFGSLNSFTLIAEHGYHISPPTDGNCQRKWELWEHFGGDAKNFAVHRNWKATLREAMSSIVADNPGSSIEEKQSSLVWHYRELVEKDTEASVQQAWARLSQLCAREHLKDVNISIGNKYLEASYRTVRKGLVMRRLCEEKALFGEPFAAVLAAGDDVSDETMFEAAPPDYLTIKVGDGQTLASFRAGTPHELREFLSRF
ncbi:unnamed protein product [Durusdinium trenchii]|uniref:Trehalose 6-phosphate phosphatase n=1 Tax=Durusdinium trenchii TaxID=1381693 RepID=A0ABP0L9G8_9DINO